MKRIGKKPEKIKQTTKDRIKQGSLILKWKGYSVQSEVIHKLKPQIFLFLVTQL